MKKLFLNFIWHMHQPYYKNPITNEYEMPWVFLHALKDYYEMGYYLEKFKIIKVNFNFVPSLLSQIKEYTHDGVPCKFIKTIRKEIKNLNKDEKSYILTHVFSSNINIIKSIPRYYDLYKKKVRLVNENPLNMYFSDSEINDLEVFFLLSWTSNAFKQKSKLIKNLSTKQTFTYDEKLQLILELQNLLKEIIPLYKYLKDKNKISLITTPFYHPILPLLIDIKTAKESLPVINFPKKYTFFKDDAEKQIRRSISFFKETFGYKPIAFWPAEGSISNETLDLFDQNGIKWTFSDEGVLLNSIDNGINNCSKYKLYQYHGVKIAFRDKYLSDLIGFSYSNWDAKKASLDFIKRLKTIYNECKFNPLVSVILDGENAWEYYQNNGYNFLMSMYSEIENQDWIETITIDEMDRLTDIEVENISNITAGSWIYANFSAWIGNDDKNTAWEILSKTKINIQNYNKNDAYINELMLIAEGSDWFWWYGDDHFSNEKYKFDYLFRANLIKIYELMKKNVPDEIEKPIQKTQKTPLTLYPNYYIFPKIDGKITSYYEWIDAGKVDFKSESTMDSSGFQFKNLYYGYDNDNLYLRIDMNFRELKNKKLILLMHTDQTMQVYIDSIGDAVYLNGKKNNDILFKVVDICEIKIPFDILFKKQYNTQIKIELQLFENNQLIIKSPKESVAIIDIGEKFEYNWYV